MARRTSRAWAVGAAALWFAACGGTSTLRRGVPTGDDDSGDDTVVGTGGNPAHAGNAGKGGGHGGTTGAQGGTTIDAGGSGARGGNGGTGAKGGSGARGGTSGTAGSAGEAGDAGGLNVDPGCTCTRTGVRSVDCSTPNVSVPTVFQDPASCTALDTRAKRQFCDDGSVHYAFVEGEENEYRLEVDAGGIPTYFSASGYVAPGCGLDSSAFDLASVSQGVSSDVLCHDACALCGEYAGLPACEACGTNPNDPEVVLETLEQFCTHWSCPATFAALRSQVGACGIEENHVMVGCGIIMVSVQPGFASGLGSSLGVPAGATYQMVFDEASGAFMSARIDDVPAGQCPANAYVAGAFPDGPCPSVETCELCVPDGEGGAGGAPGAAGAGDGSVCPPR